MISDSSSLFGPPCTYVRVLCSTYEYT